MVEIYSIKGRDSEERSNDLRVFILAPFVTDLMESFGEVMVVRDWVTCLMRL
jgi:hypothetical protein